MCFLHRQRKLPGMPSPILPTKGASVIKLGYEIGTGASVEIPLRHLAVTGQTQESGKTTTLEALITRSGLRAVAFVTKRGEKSFRLMTPISPYFREPEITAETPMWKWVGSILEAAIDEKMGKEERAAIIQASESILEPREKTDRSGDVRTTFVTSKKPVKTLAQVHENIRVMMDSSRGGFKRACICLDAYFQIVIPQINRLKSTKELELQPGVNVMDLENQTDEMQALIIRSVIETVYREKKHIVVIVPEAAKFIPNRRNSPVRFAAEMFIRQGLGIGNVLMLDSQDLANVATEVLKSVGVWILGKQTEINEVKRVVEYIPAAPKIPAVEIQQLGKGEFYAVFADKVKKVYVQPAGMTDEHAEAIATGQESADSWKQIVRKLDADTPKPKRAGIADQIREAEALAEQVSPIPKIGREAERREAEPHAENGGKDSGGTSADSRSDCVSVPRRQWEEAQRRLRALESEDSPQPLPANMPRLQNGSFAEFLRRLREHPEAIKLLSEQPSIEITIERPVLEMDGSSLQGRLAKLIADGFFREPRPGPQVQKELARRGCDQPTTNIYRAMDKLAEMGFVTKESAGYQAVPEMKVSIRENK